MKPEQLINTLGLAKKANTLIWGQHLFNQIKTGKIKLVIVAIDIGLSQKKKLVEKCNFYKVRLYESGLLATQLAQNFNYLKIVAVGIADANILKLFEKHL